MTGTVRMLIQDRESRLYFKKPNDWTADLAEAADFKEIIAAVDAARDTGRQTLDILMSFGDPKYDVRIPATGRKQG